MNSEHQGLQKGFIRGSPNKGICSQNFLRMCSFTRSQRGWKVKRKRFPEKSIKRRHGTFHWQISTQISTYLSHKTRFNIHLQADLHACLTCWNAAFADLGTSKLYETTMPFFVHVSLGDQGVIKGCISSSLAFAYNRSESLMAQDSVGMCGPQVVPPTDVSVAVQDRTAIGKKVSALKGENRYIDACRVVTLGYSGLSTNKVPHKL